MRLLIVDDHPPVRALVRTIVGALATEVVDCGRGDEAVAAVAAYRPDLVLMDIELPGMDGIAATRAIRQSFPGIPVAILTQHDAADLRTAALRAGACAYLLKDNLFALRPLLIQHS